MSEAIPISAGKRIAKMYGYDQVIILGRKTGEGGMEHLTTYGITKIHCGIAGRIGSFLRREVMKWESDDELLNKGASDE